MRKLKPNIISEFSSYVYKWNLNNYAIDGDLCTLDMQFPTVDRYFRISICDGEEEYKIAFSVKNRDVSYVYDFINKTPNQVQNEAQKLYYSVLEEINRKELNIECNRNMNKKKAVLLFNNIFAEYSPKKKSGDENKNEIEIFEFYYGNFRFEIEYLVKENKIIDGKDVIYDNDISVSVIKYINDNGNGNGNYALVKNNLKECDVEMFKTMLNAFVTSV